MSGRWHNTRARDPGPSPLFVRAACFMAAYHEMERAIEEAAAGQWHRAAMLCFVAVVCIAVGLK